MIEVVARRVISADRGGSSWPIIVETGGGPLIVKLRGAGQGTGALVAEVVAAEIAELVGLRVPERTLVRLPPDIESADRDGELRALLDASVGLNLGFVLLDGARVVNTSELDRISPDDATTIVW